MAASAEGAAMVCALPLEEVAAFSSLRVNLGKDLRAADKRSANLQVAGVETWLHSCPTMGSEGQGGL